MVNMISINLTINVRYKDKLTGFFHILHNKFIDMDRMNVKEVVYLFFFFGFS